MALSGAGDTVNGDGGGGGGGGVSGFPRTVRYALGLHVFCATSEELVVGDDNPMVGRREEGGGRGYHVTPVCMYVCVCACVYVCV